MYEVLNPQSDGDNIVAYFRNANNGSIVGISTSPHRGHLELATNETSEMIFSLFIWNDYLF
jgi:hypothetical protein